MEWMTLLLALGATVRITRLIGRDTITFFFRDWLAARTEDARNSRIADNPGKVSFRERFFTFFEDLVGCPSWCLSIWVAAPVAVLAWLYGDTGWFMVPALALTASQVTAVVNMTTEE